MARYRFGGPLTGFLGEEHNVGAWGYIQAKSAPDAWMQARKAWFALKGPQGQLPVGLDEERIHDGVVCVSGDRAVLSKRDTQPSYKDLVRVATGYPNDPWPGREGRLKIPHANKTSVTGWGDGGGLHSPWTPETSDVSLVGVQQAIAQYAHPVLDSHIWVRGELFSWLAPVSYWAEIIPKLQTETSKEVFRQMEVERNGVCLTVSSAEGVTLTLETLMPGGGYRLLGGIELTPSERQMLALLAGTEEGQ